ncbi:hypothetical protein BPUTEOMOX_1031 [methanotrophic endosymbiont of Bathymodiolus puteoserpentis (Logatchev)]|jgi:hypothetical protein|nr:hypothetical protein BPUTEOMOX_1031 [methanotrophic endosymbiont of Bathymodiolus puteoserpentis (Logatchev)]
MKDAKKYYSLYSKKYKVSIIILVRYIAEQNTITKVLLCKLNFTYSLSL